jgi:acyl carrier protein
MAKQISKEQQEILSQIVPIIAEKLYVDPTRVKMEASLSNDLGADSLDRVELMLKFDEKFNLCIPDYDPQQEEPQTIGEVVMLIEQYSEKYSKTPYQYGR